MGTPQSTGLSPEPPWPPRWEADVVLSDGGTAHVRPIGPQDASRLVRFHECLSEETVVLRFFAPYPRLSDRDVTRFTHVDYVDRLALIASVGDDIIGVARYDRLDDPDDAEVAFVVTDAHQGRGLGTVLLEHLAACARERGIRRFVADVLPRNRGMISVFTAAGYAPRRSVVEDYVELVLDLSPTPRTVEAARRHEQRAQSRSVQRLLTPRAIAVVGAGRDRTGAGRVVLERLLAGGFEGPVHPVNHATSFVASVRAYDSVAALPDDVDLVVLALPPDAVAAAVAQCATRPVRGVVVVTETLGGGPDEARVLRETVSLARRHGMRLIGPDSLGLVNTDPAYRLNATVVGTPPAPGRVGCFVQDAALAVGLLEGLERRGVGVSNLMAVGRQADVSGNDVLQFWETDPATTVVAMSLQRFGNGRRFARVARRTAAVKPVVTLVTGARPLVLSPATGAPAAPLPEPVIASLFEQVGVIRADTTARLLDLVQVLAHQPLPAAADVAVVGNAASLVDVAAEACEEAGLRPARRIDVGLAGDAAAMGAAVTRALAEPVGALLVVHAPTPVLDTDAFLAALRAAVPGDGGAVGADVPAGDSAGGDTSPAGTGAGDAGGDAGAVAGAPAVHRAAVPVVAVTPRAAGLVPALRFPAPDAPAGPGSIPAFRSPDDAARALAAAADYRVWRDADRGVVPTLPRTDRAAATALVTGRVRDELVRSGAASAAGIDLDDDETARLLACYGIDVVPRRTVTALDEARAAASTLGYPVAIKGAAAQWRHRPDLGSAVLDIADQGELDDAWALLDERTGPGPRVVQPMADPGVAVVIGKIEHAGFGPLVSFGVGGVATDLLEDRAYRILPMTDVDAHALVRAVRAAPLLLGWRGAEPADVAALEDLLLRVSALAVDLPQVLELDLNPVLVGRRGLAVLGAHARVGVQRAARPDSGPRHL